MENIGSNSIRLRGIVPNDRVQMYDYCHRSHVELSRFIGSNYQPQSRSPAIFAATNVMTASKPTCVEMSWSALRRVVDRVHSHVCGHASYSDTRTLLVRNNLWNENVQNYLSKLISECRSCVATSTPPPNRRVSLSSLIRAFNDAVCIDHFFLESVTVFLIMDVASRFSAGALVESTSMEPSIYAFELAWVAQFWPPSAVQADGSFQNDAFREFLNVYDIDLRPVPPR